MHRGKRRLKADTPLGLCSRWEHLLHDLGSRHLQPQLRTAEPWRRPEQAIAVKIKAGEMIAWRRSEITGTHVVYALNVGSAGAKATSALPRSNSMSSRSYGSSYKLTRAIDAWRSRILTRNN